MKLTADEVIKIAQLARIELTPQEQARYAETISAVLEYMKILNEVDTDDVQPTFQVTGLQNIIREDVVEHTDAETRKKLITQMPQVELEELVVPGVFNGD